MLWTFTSTSSCDGGSLALTCISDSSSIASNEALMFPAFIVVFDDSDWFISASIASSRASAISTVLLESPIPDATSEI